MARRVATRGPTTAGRLPFSGLIPPPTRPPRQGFSSFLQRQVIAMDREYSPFSQRQLNAARERQLRLNRAPAPRNKTGLRHTASFDPVVYQHITRNPNFRDPDFQSHIARQHPETVIPHDPTGFIGGQGAGGKPRNRFGQIKERFIPGIGWVTFDDSATMTPGLGDTGVQEHTHV